MRASVRAAPVTVRSQPLLGQAPRHGHPQRVHVPNPPLPEGAFVEVHVIPGPTDAPPELQEEFDAWNRASVQALELGERLAREGEDDPKA